MEEYKKLLKRLEKADKYFQDNPSKCAGKILEEYHKIIREISKNKFYDKKDIK